MCLYLQLEIEEIKKELELFEKNMKGGGEAETVINTPN